MLVPVIILLILSAINVKGTIVQKFENERLNIDLRGCGMVEKQCSHFEDDLALLSCALGTAHNNKTQLLFQCQHRIWLQQAEILDIAFLDYRLKEYCQGEPIIYCLNSGENALDCILKKKSSIREKTCWKMVNKIETLIFNDWQIVGDFLKHCLEDIQIHTCGRIPPDPNSLSQTQTLKCLENRGQNLRSECLFQINLLNDMKYSSLQTDKIIFAACSLEQTKYCPEEEPESLLLYKCLVRHKNENGMSKRCLDQMFYDQRNMVMNYRMSKGLVKSCKDDIKKYHCRKGVVDDKDVRLAQILLCLENISRNESTKLSPECISEMVEHRKMLMDDFRLSPELMQNCANDITMLCKKVETGGKTIHCLMEHARPRRKKEKRISVACQKSLETLVLETDPGEDWRVDPILRKACKPVVDRACKDINGGNGRVMSCLTEKLGSNLMTEDCETALMQIQYFISRDFKLDPQLYKACKYDAVTQCKAKLQWSDINEHPSEKDPLILPCLYNYAYNSEMKGILRPACEQQVKRVMRQRAVSVDLLPEIEDYCIDDLANLCFENTGKGEEISCLQKNMKDLAPKCREAVLNFTETQSGHIDLNPVVYINCKLPMEKLCANELKNKKNDDNVMDCLISHKSDAEIKVNVKCRAAIEHEQLISLKDYRFTKKFKNACKSYVVRFCPKAQTKSQVVTCLSEIVRNDTITRKKHTIFKDCRQQLRSQLFLQRDNSELDPDLKEACKKDLQIYCPNVAHVELAALECLQTAHGLLSNECNHYLTKSCNDMIEFYCPNIASTQTLECLKVHHQNPDFDDNCKIIIANRIKEQTTDESKNNLQNACTADIKKFCSNVAVSEYMPMEGKVVQCLKEKFRQSMLSSKCENELANVLKDQALNYRLDPLLAKLCKAEIHTICAVSNGQSLLKSAGQVEECLKNALLNHKIVTGECAREVVQIIEETEVDIEADPLLERACAVDLLKFCKDLEHGAGRRLKCLKIILNDEEGSRKLEPECEKQLSSRLEMYRYVASANELKGLGDVYQELSSSPSEKYFLVVAISIVGLIFIFGLYCGRITKKAMYIKRK